MRLILKYKPIQNVLSFELPSESYKQKLRELVQKCIKKYNGYISLELNPPYKPRTTGDLSQNNLIWWLFTQIADETGNDIEDVEQGIKERAIRRGYPYSINAISGAMKPYSMTKVNTVQMSYLIDEAYQVVAELGITLPPPPSEIAKQYERNLFDEKEENEKKVLEEFV